MVMNGISGTKAVSQPAGLMLSQTDAQSKSLQGQIQNKQEEMKRLSENKEMGTEEKMRKRQEIQKEIADLNSQLRKHQIEQRNQQQTKGTSMEDLLGSGQRTGANPKGKKRKKSGMSDAGMKAMLSADTSMKQARVQGSVATELEGKANVLETEIKLDKSRGINTEKSEEDLKDLKERQTEATASQMQSLSEADKAMEEAAKEERTEKEDGEEKGGKGTAGKGKTEKSGHKNLGKRTDRSEDGSEVGNTEALLDENAAATVKSENNAGAADVIENNLATGQEQSGEIGRTGGDADDVSTLASLPSNYVSVDVRL